MQSGDLESGGQALPLMLGVILHTQHCHTVPLPSPNSWSYPIHPQKKSQQEQETGDLASSATDSLCDPKQTVNLSGPWFPHLQKEEAG